MELTHPKDLFLFFELTIRRFGILTIIKTLILPVKNARISSFGLERNGKSA